SIAELLEQTDILIDGPFVESLRDISLQFRGSSNQRVLDLNKMRKGEGK
ncbi:MAG: 4Fe-4S cluster-binding domain-containing protein, partial [Sphaerochaetaceae bacterium]|nr:4Fe-4S cluster-binding domain-containing protein [Sphaerochaetaceae bacterium]